MRVLGYNGGIVGYPSRFGASHNAAAALVVDGELVAACEEERFDRHKHSGAFPKQAIEYCLRHAGLRSAADVDLVCYFYSFPLMFQQAIVTEHANGLKPLQRAGLWTYLQTMRTF